MKKLAELTILWYFIAIVAPIVLFALTNIHERIGILPFIICPAFMLGAAYLASGGGTKNVGKEALKWYGWNLFAGVALALILVLAI